MGGDIILVTNDEHPWGSGVADKCDKRISQGARAIRHVLARGYATKGLIT